MAEHVQRLEVGAVGARLLNPERHDRARRNCGAPQWNSAIGFSWLPSGTIWGVNREFQIDPQLQRGVRRLHARRVMKSSTVGGFDESL